MASMASRPLAASRMLVMSSSSSSSIPQPGPREGFVVDDERVDRRAAGHRAVTWPGSVPARNGVTGSSHSRNGSVSVTMAPPSSALASVSDARSP